jgi:hypothetical protein
MFNINTITVFLDLIQYIVLFFFFKHNVLRTGLCLRLQVEPTQLGPIKRISPYLRSQINQGDG